MGVVSVQARTSFLTQNEFRRGGVDEIQIKANKGRSEDEEGTRDLLQVIQKEPALKTGMMVKNNVLRNGVSVQMRGHSGSQNDTFK